MNRIIQYPLGCGLAAAVLLVIVGSSPTQTEPKVEPATHKAYTEKINDKVSFDLVPIPGGTYLAGSPASEKGRNENEGPQHPVSVKPFWMAKCEITWDEYDTYWENRPKGPPQRPDISKKPDKLPDAITSPTPPYEDRTFGYGTQGLPRHRGVAPRRHGVLCLAVGEVGEGVSLADRGRMGMGRPRRHHDRRPRQARRAGMVRQERQRFAAPGGREKAQRLGPVRHARQRRRVVPRSLRKRIFTAPCPRTSCRCCRSTRRRMPAIPTRCGGLAGTTARTNACSAVRRGSNKNWLKRDPQRPQSIWWMTDADWVGFRVVRRWRRMPA